LLSSEPLRYWELTLNVPLKHLFVSFMNLVLLRCMLAISGRSFSARNNWKHKSYPQHEEPYIKPSPEHITRLWCGIRMAYPTLSCHQQQAMAGKKKVIDKCQSQQRILQLQMQLLTSSCVGLRKQVAGPIVPAGPST